jgi:2-keto-3-deoxy-L-rhamnonate aldolase RhmA
MNDPSDTVQGWRSPFYNRSPGSEAVSAALSLGGQVRSRVEAGWALGTFVIDLPHPSTITALSIAGLDFVVLDMEHSSIDFTSLDVLLNACRAARLPALVRPWGEDTGLIGKALDAGANGIMAAHVDTPERARRVVAESRFAPLGDRGFSPLTKFDSLEKPLKSLQSSTYVVVQIEGRAALDRAGEIAAVQGIDAIFVGPYDLALSLGVEPGSDAVFKAAEKIAGEVPAGVGLGIYIDDPAKCADWAGRGFALQCVSFDGRMLSDGARTVVRSANRPPQKA